LAIPTNSNEPAVSTRDAAESSSVNRFREVVRERVQSIGPQIEADREAFVIRVLERVGASVDDASALDALALDDMFIAFACEHGNPAAMRLVSREIDNDLKAIGAKFRAADADISDVRQSLMDKLFVGPDGTGGKISEYAGRGQLRHWIRAVATRLFLDRTRQKSSTNAVDITAIRKAVSVSDPEMAAIRGRYRHVFREAFELAVAALEPDERNSLRCYYVLGMTVDQMASALGTHRATAARRVSRAREKLRAETCARLKNQLGADTGELESIARGFDGNLSVTLSGLLR
jgi:RNA polymerase sigma-70 factor (ECF subfamily)